MSLYSHTPKFIDPNTANSLIQLLEQQIQWKRFGPSPKSRLVSVWDGRVVSVSDNIIDILVNRLQDEKHVIVQGVFLNLYRDGNDYCPYHADKYGTDVYTISFGETRDILIKPNAAGTKSVKITLKSGDMYYMAKELHDTHKHSVPKRKNVGKTRISMVFFTN